MDVLSLTVLAEEQIGAARASSAGRSAHTIHGGSGHAFAPDRAGPDRRASAW